MIWTVRFIGTDCRCRSRPPPTAPSRLVI